MEALGDGRELTVGCVDGGAEGGKRRHGVCDGLQAQVGEGAAVELGAEEAGVAEADESTFNAFLAYEICDEMDIDACVITVTEADGTERSYNEVVLDGELYILDATEDGGVLEQYTPEEIN